MMTRFSWSDLYAFLSVIQVFFFFFFLDSWSCLMSESEAVDSLRDVRREWGRVKTQKSLKTSGTPSSGETEPNTRPPPVCVHCNSHTSSGETFRLKGNTNTTIPMIVFTYTPRMFLSKVSCHIRGIPWESITVGFHSQKPVFLLCSIRRVTVGDVCFLEPVTFL